RIIVDNENFAHGSENVLLCVARDTGVRSSPNRLMNLSLWVPVIAGVRPQRETTIAPVFWRTQTHPCSGEQRLR
ncbi:MAG: hypothetical protein AAF958_03760, partial [Planctomycetota bacterium]